MKTELKNETNGEENSLSKIYAGDLTPQQERDNYYYDDGYNNYNDSGLTKDEWFEAMDDIDWG